ncbi:hypothetical protein BJ138DRAFT_916807 [Hygrophoropsis aurantiaca]|uniref:Uncharacterized protein n=1 Tax=Hygrophoropsis aurantiaca TaxID=72124 RepID=A0ACB8AQY4_9AGAM|nr:hypothetical protein BJ138DRAFT_916807 [Hygrophoropsis aurantiaca]
MAFFPLFRTVVFGVVILFSIIELGVAAHLISLAEQYFYFYPTFSALAVATAVLTLASMVGMFVIDFLREEAFTSMVLVELVWLFVLWVLWVATAGEAASSASFYFPLGCIYDAYPTTNDACREFEAVEAFAFLNFFILLIYTVVIVVYAIIATSRGNNVWFTSVKVATFTAPASGAPAQQHPLSQYPGVPATQAQIPQQHTGEYNPYVQGPVTPQQTGGYSQYSGPVPPQPVAQQPAGYNAYRGGPVPPQAPSVQQSPQQPAGYSSYPGGPAPPQAPGSQHTATV